VKGDRCYLSCTECGRPCNGTVFGRQTHRFDCCGIIRAHVPLRDGLSWVRRGMESGYLTGLSTTKPQAHKASGQRGATS
jgi:hypothetical protein